MNRVASLLARARPAVPLIGAAVLACAVFAGVLLAAGKDPVETLVAILEGAFGSRTGLLQTLTRATPLLLCAVAVALPARAGLFNIGGEGQLHLGAIAATAAVMWAPGLPSLLLIPLMLLAAALAGAVWACIPAILKARFEVNEILVGLMLNYVGILLVEHLVHGPWKDPSALGWPYGVLFPDSAVMPTWGNSNVHLGCLLGVGIAIAAFVVMRATVLGRTIRILDASTRTARYVGLPTGLLMVGLMAVGGACAALAGAGEVSVIQGRLRPGISPGYGYVGFVISWLAGHRFLAVIPVAVLVGGLSTGADALQLTAQLPSATTDIFMGLVFLTFLASRYFSERRERALATRAVGDR